MAQLKFIVQAATNKFITGGFFDPPVPMLPDGSVDPAYIIVTMPGDVMPDVVRERYDPTVITLRRPATQVELDAAAQTQTDDDAKLRIADRATRSTIIWALKRMLGRNPTGAEINAARDEWVAVYKQLG